MKRRTRRNPITTVRDFTEDTGVIADATNTYVQTLEPEVIDDPGNPGFVRWKLGEAISPPFPGTATTFGLLNDVPEALTEAVSITAAGSGFDRTGAADSALTLANLVTTTAFGFATIPAGVYNLASWATPTHSTGELTIVGTGRVQLIGSGQDFIKVTGGSVTIKDIEFDGFGKLFAFNDNDTDHIDAIVADGVTFANSASGGLISYFPSTDGVLVDRMLIRACTIHDCRQGVHFRGRAAIGLARDNEIYNTQHYSIRFGQDWIGSVWQGNYTITNNNIHDQHNPISGSGHEANMIAVFGDNAVISGNTLTNLTNVAGQGDCEGIYLKSRQFSVYGNSLTDVGMDEGAIIVKGHPMATSGARDGGTITGNTVRFLTQRNYSIGINLLRGDVEVSGNQISGAGVNGIRISWRGAYENITIENNTINNMDSNGVTSGGNPLAAILLFGYGRNIMVRGNTINGAYSLGIRLENNASSATRYPTVDWTVIGDGVSIENNTVIGKGVAGSRGISVGIDTTVPLDGLRITGNKVRGFAEYAYYIHGVTGCDNWVFILGEVDDLSKVRFNSWPSTVFLGGISWSGTDTLSSGSTTKTTSHGIPSTIGAKLLEQDVQITPRSGTWGSATKWWLGTVGSSSVQVAVDAAPGGSGFRYAARIAFERVVTT